MHVCDCLLFNIGKFIIWNVVILNPIAIVSTTTDDDNEFVIPYYFTVINSKEKGICDCLKWTNE